MSLPTKFDIDYLRGAARRPEIGSLKRSSYDLMEIGSGGKVLDIGCGPGVDTIDLARRVGSKGEVIGIDADPKMVAAADAAAREAGVSAWTRHYLAHSFSLPFENGSFDACRCERVLQHLSSRDGQRTILEAQRVVRPGAPIVFIDTDWSTLSIHSHDPKFARRLVRLRQSTLQNPYVARAMKELFINAGIEPTRIEVAPIQLSVERLGLLFGEICRSRMEAGRMSQSRWDQWRNSLVEMEERNAFFACLSMITCCGRSRQ